MTLLAGIAYAHTAAGHAVQPAPDWGLLASWTFDPTFLVPLALALAYLRGLRIYRRRGGRRYPLWRAGLLLTGLGVVALALLSPVDRLADHAFTWHMVQHDALTLIGVPLMLLGAPFVLTVRGLPGVVRRRAFIPLARNRAVRAFVRLLTQPLVAFALFEVTLLFWHHPEFYDAALAHEGVHYLQHFTYVAAAALFWWNIVPPHPFPSRLHPLAAALLLVGSTVVNSGLSSMIAFAEAPLYGYAGQASFWGLSMLDEQTLGAALMWVMGAMLRLAAVLILLIHYAREEERKEPRYRAHLAGRPALR